jgi:hypothetical protein
LKEGWITEVSTIIHDFDHGGWEALHLATTTVSTLAYISQQSQRRMESQGKASLSESQETEHLEEAARSQSRSASPNQMLDLFLEDSELPTEPVKVSAEPAKSTSSRKRTHNSTHEAPSMHMPKRPKSKTAGIAMPAQSGKIGRSTGMSTRSKALE